MTDYLPAGSWVEPDDYPELFDLVGYTHGAQFHSIPPGGSADEPFFSGMFRLPVAPEDEPDPSDTKAVIMAWLDTRAPSATSSVVVRPDAPWRLGEIVPNSSIQT